MTSFHILAPPTVAYPKWATHERLSNVTADQMVLTDCCCCRMRADETTVQIIAAPDIPHGMTDDEMHDHIYSNAAYFYDPAQVIECGEGFGCTVNKRRRIGASNRRMFCEY